MEEGEEVLFNKRKRISKGKSKMNNLEKLATYDTQDEEKQNKNTTQCVLDLPIYTNKHKQCY
jgi:hypothetical protein